MSIKKILYIFILLIFCQTFESCIWARRCPEKSCRVTQEHKHESGVYRPRATFSWVTTKKHWPWSRLAGGKKYDGKKDKKTKKVKYKYTLPGEKL